MFTGIVEARCKVMSAAPSDGGLTLALDLSPLEGELALGESISINGVCLTVNALDGSTATFDAVEETIARSNLRELKQGDAVNVERSLRLGDRLGGHFVTGHVDGTGTLRKVEKLASSVVLTVECEPALTDYMIDKGSVALEGVSLTLTSVTRGRFSVALIPHTLEVTALGGKKTGAHLNIEADVLGKWVRRLLGKGVKPGSDLSMDFLAEHGFS
jgi:riboflavin synthase